jgi:hypothetical protein
MKNIMIITLFTFALLNNDCLAKNLNAPLRSTSVKVGYVLGAHEVRGCGCSFYRPGEEKKSDAKKIFSSEDFGRIAWMNLNGEDVRIDQIKSTEPMENIKKGSRYYKIYRYREMQIRIDYRVTWTCSSDMPESESCEVTHYDVKITFSQNGHMNTVLAKGVCGC